MQSLVLIHDLFICAMQSPGRIHDLFICTMQTLDLIHDFLFEPYKHLVPFMI